MEIGVRTLQKDQLNVSSLRNIIFCDWELRISLKETKSAEVEEKEKENVDGLMTGKLESAECD